MEFSDLSPWFWPSLSVVLAILWLTTLLRKRSTAVRPRTQAARAVLGTVDAEDALKAAYSLQDAEGVWAAQELARSLRLPDGLGVAVAGALVASGWAEEERQGYFRLTETGHARARELLRAHRLWERYLVEREGMSLGAAHSEADLREHAMTPQEVDTLDAELEYPAWDPHGHAIPGPEDHAPPRAEGSLLDAGTPGRRLRILSLDEDSAPLLAQLDALGLKPGVDVEILERKPGVLRLRLNGTVIPLADAVARCIYVMLAPALPVPLGELPVGSRARVVEVQGGGKHQRRMLDMGFVPGAEVSLIRRAPLGEPVEYRVKGTGIALRRAEADSVLVEELRDE